MLPALFLFVFREALPPFLLLLDFPCPLAYFPFVVFVGLPCRLAYFPFVVGLVLLLGVLLPTTDVAAL